MVIGLVGRWCRCLGMQTQHSRLVSGVVILMRRGRSHSVSEHMMMSPGTPRPASLGRARRRNQTRIHLALGRAINTRHRRRIKWVACASPVCLYACPSLLSRSLAVSVFCLSYSVCAVLCFSLGFLPSTRNKIPGRILIWVSVTSCLSPPPP